MLYDLFFYRYFTKAGARRKTCLCAQEGLGTGKKDWQNRAYVWIDLPSRGSSMKIALHQIAYQIGMHPNEMAKLVYEGEITGEVPNRNPQAKDAWVDLHSLKNFIEWKFDQGAFDRMFFDKAMRHVNKAMGNK